MKKLLILCMCILCISGTNAQKKVAIGIRGGVNFSSFSSKNDYSSQFGGNYKKRMTPGGHVGFIADIKISRLFYIQPGIYYTTMGSKEEIETAISGYEKVRIKETDMPQYLQIPILFSLRIPLNLKQDIAWRINAGPYISCGIAGKANLDMLVRTRGQSISAKEEFDLFQGGGYRRLDAGFSFGTGFDIQAFYIGINFDLGLVNTAKSGNIEIDGMSFTFNKGDLVMNNRSVSLRLGLNF